MISDTMLTALIVAAGSAASILVGLYKESRNRKWQQQDLDRRAAEAAATAKQQADDLAAVVAERSKLAMRIADRRAAMRARLLATNHAELKEALAQNTALTQSAVDQAAAALTEANNVNRKIADIGLEIKDRLPTTEPPTSPS